MKTGRSSSMPRVLDMGGVPHTPVTPCLTPRGLSSGCRPQLPPSRLRRRASEGEVLAGVDAATARRSGPQGEWVERAPAMTDGEAVDQVLALRMPTAQPSSPVSAALIAEVVERVDRMAPQELRKLSDELAALPPAVARAIAEPMLRRATGTHAKCVLHAVQAGIADEVAQVSAHLAQTRTVSAQICAMQRFLAQLPLHPAMPNQQAMERSHRAQVKAALATVDRDLLRQLDARLNGFRLSPAEVRFERQDSFAGVLGAQMRHRRVIEERTVRAAGAMEQFGREPLDHASPDARMFRDFVGLAVRPEWRDGDSVKPSDLFGPAADPAHLQRIEARVPAEYLEFIKTLDSIAGAGVLTYARLVQLLEPFEVFRTDWRHAQHLQGWGGNSEPLRWDLSPLQDTSSLKRGEAATALLAPARAEVERRITMVAVKAHLKVMA